jgi:hypothetical protein
MWTFWLLIFLCQLLQNATLNFRCLSLKNNKRFAQNSTKIDRRRPEENWKIGKQVSIERNVGSIKQISVNLEK